MANTIGRAAAEAGVHVETIRYYERRGLIERPRRPANGGYRVYPAATVGRIRFIRRAQSLGFSLSEVRDLLGLETQDDADCGDVRARAAERLAVIDEHMGELMRKRAALETLIEACPGRGDLRRCSILEALNA